MIKNSERGTITHVVNIRNPNDAAEARKLVGYVDSVKFPIAISVAHNYQIMAVERGTFYYRPGFKNQFWFFSKADAERFAADWHDWMGTIEEHKADA